MKTLLLVLISGIAAAQTLVLGTGVADTDIAAVQDAVDKGGRVTLKGHFSFDNPPARRISLEGLMATILISKSVTISGTLDEHGEQPTIRGGEIPFAVDASDAMVRFERLRFDHPKRYAILADAAAGLAVESCIIEATEPQHSPENATDTAYAMGILVSTLRGLPLLGRAGIPEKISGKISIRNNEINAVGVADESMGIMIVSVGTSEKPVDIDIAGNTIRNATQKGINLWEIGGKASIENNTILSNAVYTGRPRKGAAGIHCAGVGEYRVANNRILFADPLGAAIRLKGTSAGALERAEVTGNDLTMSVAAHEYAGERSSGIEMIGMVRNNVIKGNKIHGRARALITSLPDPSGVPVANTLDANNREGFISSAAEQGRPK